MRLELKDGDRTLATYTKRAVVERMLDAAQSAPAEKEKQKRKPKGTGRRALGRGSDIAPAPTPAVE